MTRPGEKPEVFLRTIRVALAAEKIRNDLPDPITDDWLKEKYEFDKGIAGALPYRNFVDIVDPGARVIFNDYMGSVANNKEPVMEKYRLIVGRDAKPGDQGAALTLIDGFSTPKGLAFPQIASVGVAIVGKHVLKWDKAELDYFLEHERNQLRDLAKAKDGKAVSFALRAALNDNADKSDKAFLLWNILDREIEDMVRAGAGGENGDVSWNCYSARLTNFWDKYTTALYGKAENGGSLVQLKIDEDNGKIPAGTFKLAADRLTEIYKAIPAEFAEMKVMNNTQFLAENELLKKNTIKYYRFENPEPVIKIYANAP